MSGGRFYSVTLTPPSNVALLRPHEYKGFKLTNCRRQHYESEREGEKGTLSRKGRGEEEAGSRGEERSKSVRKRLIPGLLKLRKSWK